MNAITIDMRMLNASGIGTYLNNLVPVMVSVCTDIKFNLLGNTSDLQQFEWANRDNVKLIDCNCPIYSIAEQFELFRKIPTTDIYWSPHYNIPVFPTRARKRLVTVHDVFHLAFIGSLSLKQKWYARIMLNASVKLSDAVCTVSEFSKSEIIKYTKAEEGKISVIHNGINRDKYQVIHNDSVAAIKIKYRLPDKFILFVGNVKPHKNLKRLLNAFEQLHNQGLSEYFLVIVGKKEGFITGDSEIFKLLETNRTFKDKVLFTGYLNDTVLPHVYNAASLTVSPTLYEGFGLPPLEAMACGCPVVVSNAASLPEVCGEAAYYVNPYDTMSIAEGIRKLLTDDSLRQKLIKKGLERAQRFSWEKSAKAHIKVIEGMLST